MACASFFSIAPWACFSATLPSVCLLLGYSSLLFLLHTPFLCFLKFLLSPFAFNPFVHVPDFLPVCFLLGDLFLLNYKVLKNGYLVVLVNPCLLQAGSFLKINA